MRFLKFTHQKWNMKIGIYSTGLCIPVIGGYVSIDKLTDIETVRREGLEKIVIALKKKYHMDEIEASEVPEEIKIRMGLKSENEKVCKQCEKAFVYKSHLELYCDSCKKKRKK